MALPTHVGPYQVLRVLGAGGMGIVYEARHPTTPRSVAVKQILVKRADPRWVERFTREAELLARVKHRGVVAVHQLGKTSEGPYLVAELVEGEALNKVVARGPLEPLLATRIVRDVADAVGAVHQAGVLHRDLKPHNVMLRPDGSPVLLDFGLAREVEGDKLTVTGEVLGTLAYMSPEQIGGRSSQDLDARTDVYGLGAVLFELLTGEAPYGGPAMEILYRKLQADPPSASGSRAAPPAALDAVCRVAMARAREDRYPSAAALRNDLDRVLRGERPEALGRLARARGAPRALLLVMAALIVALGVVAGVLLARRRGAAPPAPDTTGRQAPSRATEPPAAPPALWSVKQGEVLVYRLTYDEVGPPLQDGARQLVTLAATLRMQAGAPEADGAIPFRCKVIALRCGQGSTLVGIGAPWDSAEAGDADHFLAFLGLAVGREFSCRIRPQDGEVADFEGFTGVRPQVWEARSAVFRQSLPEEEQHRLIDGVFDDAFLETTMHALVCVRGPGARVPWQPRPGDAFEAFRDKGRPRVVRALTTHGYPSDTFYYTGTCRYEGGRVQTAKLEQRQVGGGVETTWSMTRLDSADGETPQGGG